MRKLKPFFLANVLLSVAISAQASDYKVCRTSFDIYNSYRKPIAYTITFNDTLVSRKIILPHTRGSVHFPYLVDKKEACHQSGISLAFRPSLECVDSVLSESHQYDTCLTPANPDSENAYKNVLSHLLYYGLQQRIDFSIVILDMQMSA